MAALRNLQIYSASITGAGWASVYTVPAGKLVVLRNIAASNTSATTAQLGLRRDTQTQFWAVTLAALGGAGASVSQDFAAAFGAGQQIGLFVTAGKTVGVILSGSIYFV
jgi:hypothetical protein